MEKNIIRNEIIFNLAERYSVEQKEDISNAILSTLSKYIITENPYSVSTINDIYAQDVKDFIAHNKSIGVLESTLKQYLCEIKKFVEYYGVDIRNAREQDIRNYLDFRGKRNGKPLKASTLNMIRSVLSVYYVFLLNSGKITINPIMMIGKLKEDINARIPLSDIEEKMFLYACKTARERAMAYLMISSGVRVNELRMMDIKDLNMNEHSANVRYGKGKKQRLIRFYLDYAIFMRCFMCR